MYDYIFYTFLSRFISTTGIQITTRIWITHTYIYELCNIEYKLLFTFRLDSVNGFDVVGDTFLPTFIIFVLFIQVRMFSF